MGKAEAYYLENLTTLNNVYFLSVVGNLIHNIATGSYRLYGPKFTLNKSRPVWSTGCVGLPCDRMFRRRACPDVAGSSS